MNLVRRFVAPAAVEFDDDAAIEANKVDDVVPDWNLPVKSEFQEMAAAQLIPDEALHFGLVVSELFGAVAILDMAKAPSPLTPLPRGERGMVK